MNARAAYDQEQQLVKRASRHAMYYYLVYLGYLVFQPLFDPAATFLDWLVVALLIATFLPLYFRAYTRGGRAMRQGALGVTVLGFLGVFFNAAATVFYIYAAAMAALALPPRRAWRAVVGLCALVSLQGVLAYFYLYPQGFPYALFPFGIAWVLTLVVGALNIYESERERINARLKLAQDEVVQLAAIAERERIARDLHDLLGHTLSLITLKAELAARLAGRDPGRSANEAREIERISRQALAEVRSAVRGYRSKGFKTELASAKLALEAAGVELEFYHEAFTLVPQQESVLALALREAVTNVIRHAEARRCQVRLYRQQGEVVLEVEDDGRGGVDQEGAGLVGMRERAALLGGSLTLESRVGKGTKLRLSFPGQGDARTFEVQVSAPLEPEVA
jgi:two-component system sensor histidine kinase DesK